MTIPVVTALRRRDRMWPSVAVSVALHAAAVGWAVSRDGGAVIDLEQKPIVAKLVRLGEKRPEEWLPRKEAEAPPPAPAPAPAVPVPVAPVPAPAPKPTAAPAPAPAKAPPPAPARATPSRGAGTTLASVLSKVEKEVDQERWGDPNGDPGGDSETGEEGNRYFALVKREVSANYRVFTATVSERERMYLKAVVALWIDPDGRIGRSEFEKRSGNASFDAAVERALRQTKLPPPPEDMRQFLRRTGIRLEFTPTPT